MHMENVSIRQPRGAVLAKVSDSELRRLVHVRRSLCTLRFNELKRILDIRVLCYLVASEVL